MALARVLVVGAFQGLLLLVGAFLLVGFLLLGCLLVEAHLLARRLLGTTE